MSIGGPGERLAHVTADQDLTRLAARGHPQALPTPTPPPARPPEGEPGPAISPAGTGLAEVAGSEGGRLRPSLDGERASSDEGQRGRAGREAAQREPGVRAATPGTALDRAAEAAAAQVARRLSREAELGIATGTGHNVGGLRFDPQGADFTLWVNHFKNEIYRNWVMPQPFFLGAQGHVDFEFVVERDGTLHAVRLLKSSGVVSFDRAAHNALTSSRFLPLPDDYRPQRVTMLLTFSYNERPLGS